MEFFATCASGLEAVLGDELRAIGVHGVRPLSGGVSFSGGLEDAYRACLWSRVAGRVLLTLARIDAADAVALYEGAVSVDWSAHVAQGSTIAVSARGTNAELRDTRFTALRVKDAICDQLRDKTGERPDVDASEPDVLVNVIVHRDRATLSIDLSGTALERRGYRAAGKPAGPPVRENLAAALLLLAGWGEGDGAMLCDPSCGNGTLAVEAALIAGDVAPGIMRQRWGFTGWAQHDEALWGRLIDEADARAAAREHLRPCVFASDADPECLAHSQACARRAGASRLIEFCAAPADLPAPSRRGFSRAALATVTPTLAQVAPAALPPLYARLGSLLHSDPAYKTLAAITPDSGFEALLDTGQGQQLRTRNGAQEALLCVHDADSASSATVTVRDTRIAVHDEAAQQFASRLNKVAKQRRKWALNAEVDAYRVYDADLPDYNLAIDLIHGAGPDEGRRCVHVSEYAPPVQIDPAKAASRLADALRIVPTVFEVAPEDVFVKRRMRAKGGSQYAAAERMADPMTLVTRENGLLFKLNLTDYLDTGLFLDHRDTRKLVGALSRGKSFLNLFAYTGTASVYAAAAGAKFTTTVDLSNTYLQWGKRNMELNGLMNGHQEFERADVLAWVSEKRHSKERWDIVFVDPPTFSNSAKMGSRSWDVQRDHAELLIGVSRLLTRQGAAVFSCNLRNFKLDAEKLARAGVQVVDITAKTIPHDFERNSHIHHCYLLKRA